MFLFAVLRYDKEPLILMFVTNRLAVCVETVAPEHLVMACPHVGTLTSLCVTPVINFAIKVLPVQSVIKLTVQ